MATIIYKKFFKNHPTEKQKARDNRVSTNIRKSKVRTPTFLFWTFLQNGNPPFPATTISANFAI